MKTIARILPLLLLPLFFGAGNAVAERTAMRTLATTGHGVASTEADTAVIRMQVSTLDKSASTAKRTVDQMINRALEALAELGIAEDDIVASTLRLLPDYQYNDRERSFSGYQASRDLTVTLDKLDKLDDVLEAATGAGINNVLSISLESSREDELRQQAREGAIADSKAKAAALAEAYGAELGHIHTITYTSEGPIAFQEQATMALSRSADQGGGGRYIHDEIEIEDRIQVVFELIVPH